MVGIAKVFRPTLVGADVVALNEVSRGATANDIDAATVIARDNITPASVSGRTANGVLRCVADMDAVVGIAEIERPARVGTDEVVHDHIFLCGLAFEPNPTLFVSGKDVVFDPIVVCPVGYRHAVPSVGQGRVSRLVGTDQVPFDEVVAGPRAADPYTAFTVARNHVAVRGN